MNSYKHNITTDSLRSVSLKISRQNIISQVTYTSNDKSSNISKNNKEKRPIIINKYKIFFVIGAKINSNLMKILISLCYNMYIRTKNILKFTQNVFMIKFFIILIILKHIKVGKIKKCFL